MRFCQSFMTGLFRHIGPFTDVPAGDIGVGGREVSFLFGQYKRLCNEFTGVLTGKGLAFGGSEIRTEATGYGCVYFMEEMLRHRGDALPGKTATVSGSGNVAQYTVEKLVNLGVRVFTMSDSGGFVHDPGGISLEKLAFVQDLKSRSRGSLAEFAREFGCEYHPGQRPWGVPCELAFPCATQNELSLADARMLIANGCTAVAEGANMPCEPEAMEAFQATGVLFAPSKAANAGGVAVSGLEMTQNSMRLQWSRDELDRRLRDIMLGIHSRCVQHGAGSNGTIDYVRGANIAGFLKVADAMVAYGVM